MPKYIYLGNDAQGHDPDANPESVVAVYEVAGKVVRVPAGVEGSELDVAIFEAAGIDPAVIQLYNAWEAIKDQAASRPMANMDVVEVHNWITANITNVNTAIALRNIATELFIIRAQMRIVEALFRNIFDA